MKGIVYILLCYLIGELLSMLIGGFVPGSVLGMLLLFAALQNGVVRRVELKSVASWLLDNMMLFFVPISVGLISALAIVGEFFWAIAVILVATTLLVIAVVGWLQQKIGGRGDR